MRKFLYAVFISIGALVALPSQAGATGPPEDLHCPDKDNPGKVESAESAGSLVLAEGTEFCAKKQTGNTGVIVADGTTTLYEYLVAAGIDGEVGEGPSYYIVYTTEPEPCDETDPESECYVPPCDVTDPQSECYEPPCDPTDSEGECYVPPCDSTDPDGECYIPPPPPPTDECPNIDGTQSEVPAGMVKDDEGNCVLPPPPPPPVDVCPNIPGDQVEIPVYYVFDDEGNCVTEPPVVPPVEEPPVEEPPVITPPPPVETPPAVVDTLVRRTVTVQPVLEAELAETGSNNTMTLALTGFGLIMAGMVLTRKGQRI